MVREYQNGDGFGYILAFRKQGMPTWTVVRVPHVESSRYVYSNESLSAYCPFEVRIKAYNKKGEGPFSQIAVVHSAEEGEKYYEGLYLLEGRQWRNVSKKCLKRSYNEETNFPLPF